MEGIGEGDERAGEGMGELYGEICFHDSKRQQTQEQHQCPVKAFLLDHCLPVSIAVMKNHNQKQSGEKWVYFTYHSPSLKAAWSRIQTGQEPRVRSGCRGHGEVLLTVLLPTACSHCFLIEHEPRDGTTYNGLATPISITS